MNADLNILVADDNEDDVFLLRQAFKKASANSRLQAVCDGCEALAYLNGDGLFSDRTTHPWPDILLLDLNMPRMNGFEVLERVRQHPLCDGLIVYVLTASCREEDMQRAYALRANSYMIKPNRVDELVGFVTALHLWHQFVCLPSRSLNPKRRLDPPARTTLTTARVQTCEPT